MTTEEEIAALEEKRDLLKEINELEPNSSSAYIDDIHEEIAALTEKRDLLKEIKELES